MITGEIQSGTPFAQLYVNDGQGNYSAVSGAPFEPVLTSSVAFADIDGDGDEDVFISGRNSSGVPIAKMYANDGLGNFTEILDTPFEGVALSSIAFADIDGDDDPDLLIAGMNDSESRIAKLYINLGQGNYTEVLDTPFQGVSFGSMAFADADGDNDMDVLITGLNPFSVPSTKLYTNDGSGNFSEAVVQPFENVFNSSIAFSDIDNDGDIDVYITGTNPLSSSVAILYANDGAGGFTEIPNTPFPNVLFSAVRFSDLNGDLHPDVIISGLNTPIDPVSLLYLNDGSGNFAELEEEEFEGLGSSSINILDVNSDGYPDVLLSGRNSSFSLVTKLYINDGSLSSVRLLTGGLGLVFIAYPNPSYTDQINISLSGNENESVSLELLDQMGRTVLRQDKIRATGSNTFSINISQLAKGSYILRVSDDSTSGSRKVLVH